MYSYWVPNRERSCGREARNWIVLDWEDQCVRYPKINLAALRSTRLGLATVLTLSGLNRSPSPEMTEVMRGEMAETLVLSLLPADGRGGGGRPQPRLSSNGRQGASVTGQKGESGSHLFPGIRSLVILIFKAEFARVRVDGGGGLKVALGRPSTLSR